MDLPQPTGVILGFDPGGKDAFGWSVCHVIDDVLQPLARTGLACDASGALDGARRALEASAGSPCIVAAGIDAPLRWSKRGGRRIDAIIRGSLSDSGFATPSGTVQHFNSLRGSCVVQGVLLARFLHEAWGLEITETHPKALEHLLRNSDETSMVGMVDDLTHGKFEHERDATLSAIAAWAMNRRLPGWRNLYEEEPCLVQPFGTPVSYWMPIA